MPKCSKCNTMQSKMNKGNLCKTCFRAKHKLSDNVISVNDDDVSIVSMEMEEDRTIIEIIKNHMQKECQWNKETHQILLEQINYLKDEIKHKNTIIEGLIKTKCNIPSSESRDYINQTDITSLRNEGIIHNTNTNINDRIVISPDASLNCGDDVYANVESDDINSQNTNDKITNRSKYSYRNLNQKNILTKDAINFEHQNRFEDLRHYEDDGNVVKENYMRDEIPNSQHLILPDHRDNIRPHVVVQDYPEKNYIKKPVRPGENQYNQALKDGKTTVVFSTSITKGIFVRDFNNEFKIGTARFRRFHGAKSKYMKHYVIPTLYDECPQVVLLQCGGNDLPTSKQNPKPVQEIAEEIIDTAKICENYGAENILIGSVITRKQGYVDIRRKELNTLLKGMCYNLGYVYIDNDNIEHAHLYRDGVHLTHEGSDILAKNYLHSLNNIY